MPRAIFRGLTALCSLTSVAMVEVAVAQELDVTRQDVVIDLTQPGELHIELDIVARATTATDALLLPMPLVPHVTATVDGVAATVTAVGGAQALRIGFPVELAAGEEAQVVITMSGPPSCGGSAAFCFHSPTETILTVPQPGSAWHYGSYSALDPYVGSVEVLAPSAFTVVAGQGAPVSVVAEGAAQRWRFDVATPTELLGLYAGTPQTLTVDGPIPVTALYHASEHDAEVVARAVEVASELLPIFGAQYGPLPVDHVHLITTPKNFVAGGLGLLGQVFFNGVVFSSHDYLAEQGTAHELAHSWWGNLASGAAFHEAYFLGEGMAEYAAWRALGVARSPAVRTAGMRMNAVWYQYRRPNDVDVPILAFNVGSSSAYVHVTYHKGALVMRALEETLGEAAMGRALERFVARGYGQLSIAGLIEDVLTESGFDATTFVDQWMRATGFPYLYVTPTWDGDAVELTVEVVGAFDLSLPIRFTFPDGSTREEQVALAQGVTTHRFELEERPAAVALDPDWTMPREVAAASPADVNLDATVDAADLIDVALRVGSYLPDERRVDGGYDPLFDVDRDRVVGPVDLDAVVAAALATP